jgi:hypothetical protein
LLLRSAQKAIACQVVAKGEFQLMTKDEFEKLKNAHEFYQEILEHDPPDINKDFKEKYELKSKLFEIHQRDRKSNTIAYWLNILLILLYLVLIYYFFIKAQ